jgi:hypothetical protein
VEYGRWGVGDDKLAIFGDKAHVTLGEHLVTYSSFRCIILCCQLILDRKALSDEKAHSITVKFVRTVVGSLWSFILPSIHAPSNM